MAAFSLLYLRVAPEVKEELEREARKAGRSLNEEAVGRLRRSLGERDDPVGARGGRDLAADALPGAASRSPSTPLIPDVPGVGRGSEFVRPAFSKADQAEGKRR